MARHLHGCPVSEDIVQGEDLHAISIPTALMTGRNGRCPMQRRGRCRGKGITSNSLMKYCPACSEGYGLCEVCGQPFTRKNPRDTIAILVAEPNPDGSWSVTSPFFGEIISIGKNLEEAVRSSVDEFKLVLEREKDFPDIKLQ